MNKSQRIYLNTGNTNTNNYIKFQLEQDIDTLEFLSLNLSTKDAYQDFNSDYGVLVGRVNANGSVGIPNAKISIFIPLSDEDAENSEIASIYPYKTPRDKNLDGKRYNLLPRVSQFDVKKNDFSPKQPFGSFPTKPEIVTNQSFLNVYKKYYKYSTVTNGSGDYMIFGVPVGVQTVHLSVDITDIGEYSMTPSTMVTNLGYSSTFFTDNNTKIKPSNDLNDLPNIETQEISVDILPFWGDSENFIIGITRQDFRIRATIVSTFVMFGSAFTDGENSTWGSDNSERGWRDNRPYVGELYFLKGDRNVNIGIGSKRIGKITEKIYYYPGNIKDSEISTTDPITQMAILDATEYSSYKRDGDFVFIINCNRNKVITNESGDFESVDDDSPNGVYTEFKGFVTLEITAQDIPNCPAPSIADGSTVTGRMKLKFPQYADYGKGFDYEYYANGILRNVTENNNWRKQHYTFKRNNFYSFSKFHGIVFNDKDEHSTYLISDYAGGVFMANDRVNDLSLYGFFNCGIIWAKDEGDITGNNGYQFPSNGQSNRFGANWLNLCIHFPQFSRLASEYKQVNYLRSSTAIRPQRPSNSDLYFAYNSYYYAEDWNLQPIAAGQLGTTWYGRSDLQWTDFINVPIDDIKKMKNHPNKGFNDNELRGLTLTNYHNGTNRPSGWPTSPCPTYGGKLDGLPTNGSDPKYYFYKGLGSADCISYLFELGLISEQ